MDHVDPGHGRDRIGVLDRLRNLEHAMTLVLVQERVDLALADRPITERGTGAVRRPHPDRRKAQVASRSPPPRPRSRHGGRCPLRAGVDSARRVEGIGDGTRAIGMIPADSAATQIIAAVSSDVALSSRSTNLAVEAARGGDHRRLALRIWLPPCTAPLRRAELFLGLVFEHAVLVTNFLSSGFTAPTACASTFARARDRKP